MTKCATCGLDAERLNGADDCEGCADAYYQQQLRYWRPLYEGEKQAGLVRGRDDE